MKIFNISKYSLILIFIFMIKKTGFFNFIRGLIKRPSSIEPQMQVFVQPDGSQIVAPALVQNGGSPEQISQPSSLVEDLFILFNVLLIINFVDLWSKCKRRTLTKTIISVSSSTFIQLVLFTIIKRVILSSYLTNLKLLGYESLSYLVEGSILFFIYNFTSNIRDIFKPNCDEYYCDCEENKPKQKEPPIDIGYTGTH